MVQASAILLFVLAAASVAFAGCGARMLLADNRLRARLSGRPQRPGQPGQTSLRLPRLFMARGRDREEIEKKLRSAGMFGSGALVTFLWLRLAATAGMALAVMLYGLIAAGNPFAHVFPLFALPGLTYIGAKYILQMRATDRERTLTAEFPFLLDLMLMMLESGISLDQCFRAIARDEQVAVPHHARLLAMLVDDLDRGQDYQNALDRWAARVSVAGARELAALFRQSLFQGMELVPALREFIIEFSQRRVTRAREAIGTITVRMVILMLVFFMPALFIVLAAPPVVAIFDTLRSTAP
ncbi:type II secretion system F family protein [Novosphingobium sp. PP1Y]|uniref:type II secretion system F family protein n=1 Tax=Novosphingobium sp. PP1Y TaxID=702113 RepID=UPI00020EFBDD|nr:type II secretion system F family protein [Novosphingobium sp. PP1Y]CCA90417.1 tight adherence protein C [Novosphingobium sp. PP1Y]